MKLLYLIFVLMVLQQGLIPKADAQIIWNTGSLTFAKANFADPTDPANQDRLTSNVWITRGNQRGLFNIHNEPAYGSTSPTDTEWSFGTITNYATLTYTSWVSWVNDFPPGVVNQDAVLHLISENIYIGIKFLSWTQSATGGGFSYQRTTPGVLPVNFVSFSALPGVQKVTLNWVTAQEQNSRSFDIEHGTDGLMFNSIGSITTSGNSNDNRSYSFTHYAPASGNNYYRLKQTDLDGNYRYSKVVTVALGSKEVSISFKPASTSITLTNSTAKEMWVQLLTSNGAILKKEKYVSNTATINIKELPAGTYIVQVIANGSTYTKQIVKH